MEVRGMSDFGKKSIFSDNCEILFFIILFLLLFFNGKGFDKCGF
jgi:hypothetical protein